jgi:hypothetical protein
MPRTQQDQPNKRRPDPTTTPPDDEEAHEGDVTRMEEAGNLPRRGGQQAADPAGLADEADVDETDEGEDEDLEDDEAEEPIGGRV